MAKHQLISSVCISQNGSMIWNYTDKSQFNNEKYLDDELNYIYQK